MPSSPSVPHKNGDAATLFGRRRLINASWPISRVLCGGEAPRDDHSSWTPVAGRLALPTRTAGPETSLETRAPRHPYSVLLPVGFTMPDPLPGPRWALTPPFHPYPYRPKPTRRFAFCGTFPGVTPAGRYPAPCFRGARTFLSGNLAVLPERPSSQLTLSRWQHRGLWSRIITATKVPSNSGGQPEKKPVQGILG